MTKTVVLNRRKLKAMAYLTKVNSKRYKITLDFGRVSLRVQKTGWREIESVVLGGK